MIEMREVVILRQIETALTEVKLINLLVVNEILSLVKSSPYIVQ